MRIIKRIARRKIDSNISLNRWFCCIQNPIDIYWLIQLHCNFSFHFIVHWCDVILFSFDNFHSSLDWISNQTTQFLLIKNRISSMWKLCRKSEEDSNQMRSFRRCQCSIENQRAIISSILLRSRMEFIEWEHRERERKRDLRN